MGLFDPSQQLYQYTPHKQEVQQQQPTIAASPPIDQSSLQNMIQTMPNMGGSPQSQSVSNQSMGSILGMLKLMGAADPNDTAHGGGNDDDAAHGGDGGPDVYAKNTGGGSLGGDNKDSGGGGGD